MNALAKITNLAKGLQQRDPRLTWKAAIKQASQMYRSNQDAGVKLASRKLGATGGKQLTIRRMLKNVYTAAQCTDVSDCDIALTEVQRIAKEYGANADTRNRIRSILDKRAKLAKKGIGSKGYTFADYERDYDRLPKWAQSEIDRIALGTGDRYKKLLALNKKLAPLGITLKYGLDAEPYEIRFKSTRAKTGAVSKKSMTLTGPQLITFVNTLLAYEIADNDHAEFMTVPQAIKAVKPYGIKVVKRGTKYVLSE